MTRHGVMEINNKPAPLPVAAVNGVLDALMGQFLSTMTCCAKTAGIKTAAVSGTTLCSRTLRSFEQIDCVTAIGAVSALHGLLRAYLDVSTESEREVR
jgi:hypothetical protein